MDFDLSKATILLVLTGSRGYGTNNESSDWDYRGVAIPPLNSYIGINPLFEQAVDGNTKHVWKHYPTLVEPEADMQVMELTKFCRLAADCNPSIIEILFADKIIFKHPIAEKLIENRNLFLSRRAKARFCGYALSQLNRIKRHKRWYDNPPTRAPKREDYGLPGQALVSADQIGAAEALIQREVDAFMIDQTDLPEHTKIELHNGMSRMMRAVWVALQDKEYPIGEGKEFASHEEALSRAVMQQEGFSGNFIEILVREKKYRSAQKEWESYQTWLKERNSARAELEQKFGFDTKHGMHLVRLLRMAREILVSGEVNVWRKEDYEELKAIRLGAWSYEKMVEYAEAEDIVLADLVKKSILPAHPDSAKIQDLVFNMVMEFNNGKS